MVNVNMEEAPPLANQARGNSDIIRNKLKSIMANVLGCKMNEVRLKLQYNKNANTGCNKRTRRGCSKNRLGGGAYGTAYKAYANNGKSIPLVVKESRKHTRSDQESKIEHDTIRVLRNKGFQDTIPRVYGYVDCGMQEYLFSDLVNGVALKDFRPTSEHQMSSIITQVLYTLYRVNKSIPSFRHHDLHQDNVMIVRDVPRNLTLEYPVNSRNKYTFNNGGVRAVIIDFGLAHVNGVSNPKIEDGGFKHAGIHPKSHSIYDTHFFLNAIYLMIINKSLEPATSVTNTNKRTRIIKSIERVQRYIEKHFEIKYLGMRDTKLITGGRLTLAAQGQLTNKKRIGDFIKDLVLLPVQTPPGSDRQVDLPPSRSRQPNMRGINMKNLWKNLVAHQARRV